MRKITSLRTRILAACFIAGVALCIPGEAAAFRERDTGGPIADRILEIAAAAGARHEIGGDCISSCTMWLGASGACVRPDAVLWFHSARGPSAAFGERGERSEIGNRALLVFYPPRVRRAVLAGGYLDGATLRPMTAAQLVRLGVRPCD